MTQAPIGHTYTSLDELVDLIIPIVQMQEEMGATEVVSRRSEAKSLIQDYVDRVAVGKQ